MKEKEKNVYTILLVLAFFIGIRMCRYIIPFHNVPLQIFQSTKMVIGSYVIYCVLFLLFVKSLMQQNKILSENQLTYYVLFISLFQFSFYLNENYAGSMDVYGWIFFWMAYIISEQYQKPFIGLIFAALSILFCPMMVFLDGAVMSVIYLHRFSFLIIFI